MIEDKNSLENKKDKQIVNKLIFFKSQFRSEAKSIYGAFYVVLEPISHITVKVLQFDCVVSRYRNLLTENFSSEEYSTLNCMDINERIQFLRKQKEYSEKLTRQILSQIEVIFSSNKYLDEFYSFIVVKKQADISYFLNYQFNKVLTDVAFDFSFYFESLLQSEFIQLIQRKKFLNNQAQEELQQNYNLFQEEIMRLQSDIVSSKNLLLGAGFFLSPASGKFVDDLNVGDSVYIKLDFQYQEQVRFVSTVLNMSEENMNMIVGVVYAIRKSPLDENFFIIKIDEGIYAKVMEVGSVKIKSSFAQKKKMLDQNQPKRQEYYDLNFHFFQKLLLWLIFIAIAFLVFILIDLLD